MWTVKGCHVKIVTFAVLVIKSVKQLSLIYFTTLACKSLSSMSYYQSREFINYLQKMIIDSRGEIRELLRVQIVKQIVLIQILPFLNTAKTMSIANFRLKSLSLY